MHFLRKWIKSPAAGSNRPAFCIRGELRLEAEGLPACVALARNGKYLLAAARNGQINVWETASCTALEAQQFAGIEVSAAAMDNQGRWAVVAGASPNFEGMLGLADLQQRNMSVARLHERPVNALDIAPDGSRIATGGLDWAAKVSDPETLDVYLGHRHPDWVTAVRFTPSGKELVSASWDWTVKTVDIAQRNLLSSFECEPEHYELQLSPDGSWLAACKDTLGVLVDTQTGMRMAAWEIPGALLGVNTHPTHRELVWLGQGQTLSAYSPRQAKILFSLPALQAGPASFSSALDGRLVAVGAKDGAVRLVEMP